MRRHDASYDPTDLWHAFECLFGESGAVGGCWCMYGRIGRAIRTNPREENKTTFREIVERGPPPGLLAFDGDIAVGWCQLTPRDALRRLDRTWRLKRVDEVSVWALSCFLVRKVHHRRGVTSALIAAALSAAKRATAPALEADPLDADKTPSASGTGYASTLARAGFKTVVRRAPPRPIMRHDLTAVGACCPHQPDDWTAIVYRGKPAADGPRYRAIGNSMAVPVVRWMLERVAAVEGDGGFAAPARNRNGPTRAMPRN